MYSIHPFTQSFNNKLAKKRRQEKLWGKVFFREFVQGIPCPWKIKLRTFKMGTRYQNKKTFIELIPWLGFLKTLLMMVIWVMLNLFFRRSPFCRLDSAGNWKNNSKSEKLHSSLQHFCQKIGKKIKVLLFKGSLSWWAESCLLQSEPGCSYCFLLNLVATAAALLGFLCCSLHNLTSLHIIRPWWSGLLHHSVKSVPDYLGFCILAETDGKYEI